MSVHHEWLVTLMMFQTVVSVHHGWLVTFLGINKLTRILRGTVSGT